MNRHKPLTRMLSVLAIAAAALSSNVAHADTAENDFFYRQDATSQLSRAEVLADLKIYQDSGLADVERLDSELGHDSPRLQAARDRYAQLRHSDRYTALVAQYMQRTTPQARQQRGA